MAIARRNEGATLAESYPLSIIIPTFNAELYLERVLSAVTANDLEKVQILLIDDGSTDSTIAIAERFPQVDVVRLGRRGGPAEARNAGADRAAHQYLLFLDADVVLPENAVLWIRETLDLYHHRQEVAGVLGSYSDQIPAEDFLTNYKNLTTCFLYWITDTQSPFLHTPIFAIEKSIFDSGGRFDARLEKGEDFRLGVKLGTRGYRFIIDRRIKGVHLKRYSLMGLLREDWERVQALRRLELKPEEKRFAYSAHRWTRLLSVMLPIPVLLSPLLGWLDPWWMLATPALLLLFLFLNFRLLSFLRRKKGWKFVLPSSGFLFLEMLWAQLALFFSVLPTIRTSRRGLKSVLTLIAHS